MDWAIVWSLVVGMAMFLLGIAMIGAVLVWLMIHKVKKRVQAGAVRKFTFPCASFFCDKTETATK